MGGRGVVAEESIPEDGNCLGESCFELSGGLGLLTVAEAATSVNVGGEGSAAGLGGGCGCS